MNMILHVVYWHKVTLTVCVVLMLTGCSIDTEKKIETQVSQGWLTRNPTPVSEFAPDGIETVIDNVVIALNATEQQVGMKLVFMPKVLDTFFEDAVLGANRAFAELSILGSIAAPERLPGQDGGDDAAAQQEMFESQLNEEEVFNFGIAPNSPDIVADINTAVNAGGTVVTFDTDKPSSLRQFYIGTNSTEAGITAATTMIGLLENINSGTVVILGYTDSSWGDGYNRAVQSQEVLENAGYTVVMLHTAWEDYDSNVTAIREAFASADPPAVGCLGLFNISYACADAVVADGLEGSIKIAAFDAEPTTLQYLNDGVIQVTHTQRVYYMGYLLPYVVYSVQSLGIERTRELFSALLVDDERIDTGLDIIPASRLSQYDSFMDQLSAL